MNTIDFKLSDVWHKGTEKPSIWIDSITGNEHETYAICIIWYDGWVEDFCKVTADHMFVSMTSGKTYSSTDFEYWAYTHDLISEELDIIDTSMDTEDKPDELSADEAYRISEKYWSNKLIDEMSMIINMIITEAKQGQYEVTHYTTDPLWQKTIDKLKNDLGYNVDIEYVENLKKYKYVIKWD